MSLPTWQEIERGVILCRLKKMGWHRERTAKSLGIGLRTLGLKISIYRSMGYQVDKHVSGKDLNERPER